MGDESKRMKNKGRSRGPCLISELFAPLLFFGYPFVHCLLWMNVMNVNTDTREAVHGDNQKQKGWLTDVQSGLDLYSFEDGDWPMSYPVSICTQFIHPRSCLGFSIRVVINTRRVAGFYFLVLRISLYFQYFECLLYEISFNTIVCFFLFLD